MGTQQPIAWRMAIRWIGNGLGLMLLVRWGVAQLPQDHPYQVTLRNYIASLTESDFNIAPASLSYIPSYFASEDNLYRTWLMTGSYSSPRTEGLRYPSARFTLQAIEGTQIFLPYLWPHEIAWWAQWDYPGNPFYGSRAVKLRAFVSAAVDMMMLDRAHERGCWCARSDFLGGTLIWLGYTYGVVKDVLPPEVQAAYEEGLMKFFTRIEQWGPTGAFGDMDAMAIVGMFYTAQAIGDPALMDRAQIYATRVINLMLSEGMEIHQGGYDASYNGVAIFFLTWAALATNWEMLNQLVDRFHYVKSHLTLPEPDGTFYGPSHFSSNTSADVASDQWSASPPRDIGAAMVSDQALYLAFGGRNGRTWAWAVPDVSRMSQAVQSWIASINSALNSPLNPDPSPWGERHWIRSESSTFAADYYRPGTYARLRQLLQSSSPLTVAPFRRQENFLEHLMGTRAFLSARFARYGVILFTGRLSGQIDPISGFGGGNLSAFWTPQTGSVILGRRRGFQGSNIDRWTEWRTWPVNAMSGAVPDGRAFTTAGYRPAFSEREYWVYDNYAVVDVRGRIGNAFTAQNGAIRGNVQFTRHFIVTPQKVTINAGLTSDGVDQVVELYETVPLFLHDNVWQRNVPHKIWFLIDDQWNEITSTNLYSNVQQIKVERFSGAVRIVFDTPQRVKLSDQWVDGFQSGATCRNLLFDLLGNEGQPVPLPAAVSIRYHILPMIQEDINGDGCVDDADLLAVLLNFGRTGNLLYDVNRNGIVDDADLVLVLFAFGQDC